MTRPDGSLDRAALDRWLTTDPRELDDDDDDGLACGAENDHVLDDGHVHRCELDAAHDELRHECPCGLSWVVETVEGIEVVDEPLVLYVMALEELVRWLAIPYAYNDPNTGELVQNEPIWATHNQYGQALPANDRLARTWRRVFGEGRET